MKSVIFSFDDARHDFYIKAFPILQQYNLTATLNVISDFILSPSNYTCFGSGCNQAMTPEELIDCQNNGIEIACHGHLHLNTKEDILQNIKHLKSMGLKFPRGIGFASPNSEITEKNKNEHGVWDIYQNGTIAYIRSGTQILREGICYTILSLIDRYIHSPRLWYWLNQNNILHTKNIGGIIPSMTIHSYTTIKQIQNMIDMMPDDSAIILMFHSICDKMDQGYGKDKWYWDSNLFEKLCAYIQDNKSIINMVTTIDYLQQK